MFISHLTQTGRAQEEELAKRRFNSQPLRGENAEDVSARKQQHVSRDCSHPFYHAIGASSDLLERLATGATVSKQLPPWPLSADVGRPPPFVLSIVPFHQIGINLDHASETGEFARA